MAIYVEDTELINIIVFNNIMYFTDVGKHVSFVYFLCCLFTV